MQHDPQPSSPHVPRRPAGPRLRDLPAAVWIILVVIFVSYIGLGVVVPVRVLYAQQVGLSLFEIGLMTSAFFLSQFVFQIPTGVVADRLGRRRTMLAGLSIHALTAGLYLVFDQPWVFILLRVVEGVGASAIQPAARALIADLVPEGQRGRAYGLYRAAFQGSMLAGPALGGLLAGSTGFEVSYLISAGARVVGFALVLGWLREPPHLRPAPRPVVAAARAEGRASGRGLGELFSPPLLVAYLVGFGTSVTQGLDHTVWAIYLQDIGSPLAFIGLTFTIRAATALLLTPFGGALADRWSQAWVVLLSGLVWTATCGLLAVWRDLPAIALLVLGQGLAMSLLLPAIDRYVADQSPVWGRARVQSIFQAAAGAAAGLFGLLTGPLYELGQPLPFLALAGIQAVSVLGGGLAMLFLSRRPAALASLRPDPAGRRSVS